MMKEAGARLERHREGVHGGRRGVVRRCAAEGGPHHPGSRRRRNEARSRRCGSDLSLWQPLPCSVRCRRPCRMREVCTERSLAVDAGWPTVRYFNQATGYDGAPYEKKTQKAVCDELGDLDTMREAVETAKATLTAHNEL